MLTLGMKKEVDTMNLLKNGTNGRLRLGEAFATATKGFAGKTVVLRVSQSVAQVTVDQGGLCRVLRLVNKLGFTLILNQLGALASIRLAAEVDTTGYLLHH